MPEVSHLDRDGGRETPKDVGGSPRPAAGAVHFIRLSPTVAPYGVTPACPISERAVSRLLDWSAFHRYGAARCSAPAPVM